MVGSVDSGGNRDLAHPGHGQSNASTVEARSYFQRCLREITNIDERVKGRFDLRAASVSDKLLGLSLITPLLLQTAPCVTKSASDTFLTQFKAMAATTFFTQVMKMATARNRPYTYSADPCIQRYTKARGTGAAASFYSNHASATFASAVIGASLFSALNSGANLRPLVWGAQTALAAMASNLRVIAGQHFYSDVLAGAFAGVVCGVAMSMIDGSDQLAMVANSGDVIGIVGGLLLGTALSNYVS